MLKWARIATAAVVAVTFAVAAGTAAADEWGDQDSDTGPHPDEDPHTFCRGSSIGDYAWINVIDIEWAALDPTAVNVDQSGGCNYSGTSETDVVWQTGDLPGHRGQTWCDDYETFTGQCDQAYAKLDLAEINEGTHDEADMRKTICHELGHTAGLTHGGTSTDCMITGERPQPALTQHVRYGSHHQDHIADWF